MKTRAGLLLTCATSALILGVGSLSGALAADMPVKAAPVVEGWWYHFYVEAGGRAFLNNPQRDGNISFGGQSLAKYYEYSTVKPGPFLDGSFAIGSNNGLYQINGVAKNVGYSDQSYFLDASKAGEHYIALGWDQTPHVYSTSALTLYNGVGTNHLTLPAGLSNQMFIDAGCTPGPVGCGNPIAAANAALVKRDIQNNVHQTDIGIRRDTAAVDYRYTPTPEWDFNAYYTNTRRTGTQIDGVVFSPGTSGVVSQVTKPIADTTQNYGASGEYAGTSLWGRPYTFQVGYGGSTFSNDFDSYTVENPFCPAGAVNATCARNGSVSAPTALMSLAPDNQANAMSGTLGVELPLNSRYMGTVSYNMMRQNQSFLPFTLTPFTTTGGVPTGWVGGAGPVNTLAGVLNSTTPSSASLNGAINTLLVNNVLTTQITPDLKSKLYYRYYDFDNQTAEILFRDWVLTDAVSAKATNASYAPVSSLSISYTKQNGGAEMNWRPIRSVNVGAGYAYERYDWTRADADVTNEHSGKAYIDWKPTNWFAYHASTTISQRTFENYDYTNFVANTQWPVVGGSRYNTAYRQFMLDDRNRLMGKMSASFQIIPRLTVTPTVSWRNDHYKIDPATELGLVNDESIRYGVEAGYVLTPDTTLLVAYMREQFWKQINGAGGNGPAIPAASFYSASITDNVDTVMAGVNYAVIPNKFDVKLSYTLSHSEDTQPIVGSGVPTNATWTGLIPGQYPAVTGWFQRFDAIAKYRLDDDFVRQLGWKGTVTAKLRYAYERNAVNDWHNDMMQTYMYSSVLNSVGYMNWMAFDNPNYNVHLVAASIGFAW